MRKNTICFIVISTLFFVSCGKKELPEPEVPVTETTEIRQGLPAEPQKINGYLYAGLRVSRFGMNYYSNTVLFANFGDPDRNLIANFSHAMDQQIFTSGNSKNAPNVSVGRVYFNGLMLGGSGQTNYFISTPMDTLLFEEPPEWVIEGNKTFEPFSVTLPRKGPDIINSLVNFSLQVSNGYTLNMSDLLAGYDSAAVMISSQSAFPAIYKATAVASPVISFSPSELVYLKNRTSSNIMILGYNYSSKTVAGKVYVFEMAAKLERILTIKP
jgi:hypothetical protein